MATFAIGDIHGNLAALDDLLTTLESELHPADELVFLGDYIDDGPDVAGCIRRIIEVRERAPCRVVALMGNHEQWMLRSRESHRRHSWLLGMDGLRTVESYSSEVAAAMRREIKEAGALIALGIGRVRYERFFEVMPPSHLDFFLGLQVFHESPDVLCVHGGVGRTDGPLGDYPADALIWGPPGFPDSYEGDDLVVYGHHNNAILDDDGWPRPHVTRACAFGIDTIRHGVLTAMRFPDRKVFQSSRFVVDDAADKLE
jgi:serine/threonine protein phosphatase 1